MNSTMRTVIGLALVIVGVFWGQIREWKPTPFDPAPVIEVEQPSEEILERVSSISKLVTDDEDRLRLAVFNKVFSDRVGFYDANSQQVNDIYTKAGKIVFDSSLRGKYDGYSSGLTGLFKDSLGSKNGKVTTEQKIKLSKDFSGLAYSLAN